MKHNPFLKALYALCPEFIVACKDIVIRRSWMTVGMGGHYMSIIIVNLCFHTSPWESYQSRGCALPTIGVPQGGSPKIWVQLYIDVMMNTAARLDNCSIRIFNNTNRYDILQCQLDFLEPWSHDQIQTHQCSAGLCDLSLNSIKGRCNYHYPFNYLSAPVSNEPSAHCSHLTDNL